MVFDPNVFIDALEEATRTAVRDSLEDIADRARHKAPVRKIFAGGRKRRLRGPIGVSAVELNEKAGPAFYYPSRRGLEIQRIGEVAGVIGARRSIGRYEIADRQIRGRVNSFAPVIKSPAGMIGGEALRTLSARGVLKVQEITHPGGRFSVHELLSGRGAYEVRKGRAISVNPETGEETVGGTLRGSIKVEGPYVGRGEVYGFVSAAAFNERGFNYALAQEIGTGHNRPQPYLRPALRELRDTIVSEKVGGRAKSAFRKAFASASSSRTSNRGFRRNLRLKVDIVGFDRLGGL